MTTSSPALVGTNAWEIIHAIGTCTGAVSGKRLGSTESTETGASIPAFYASWKESEVTETEVAGPGF